jgi:hypothetical protein
MEIQEENAQKTMDALSSRQQTFRVVRRGINSTKRSKVSVVPEVHTSHAQEVRRPAAVENALLTCDIDVRHLGRNRKREQFHSEAGED